MNIVPLFDLDHVAGSHSDGSSRTVSDVIKDNEHPPGCVVNSV